MFQNRNTGNNWRFAFLELVLIFLGVTLAFLFENWNQNRKDRQMELLVLKELVNDLESDRRDLNLNIRADSTAKSSFVVILKAIEEKLPFQDSMARKHFRRLSLFTNFIENKAAFENLKSIGFNFVSNDSLRYKIIRYYESNVQLLNEVESGFVNKQEHEVIRPYMQKHFDYSFMFNPAYPNDYTELISDPEFKSIVGTIDGMFQWKISISRRCLDQATDLISDLEEEIERLE